MSIKKETVKATAVEVGRQVGPVILGLIAQKVKDRSEKTCKKKNNLFCKFMKKFILK